MIYCNLKGGLGNMMFQIAATKSYAIDLGVEPSFPNLTNQMEVINNDLIHNPSIKHAFEYEIIFNSLKREHPTNTTELVRFPFEYVDYEIRDNSTVDGFFQSEKYFNHNREEVLKIFKKPDTITEYIEKKYNNILSGNTVSLHVRRGDYLKFPNHHKVLTLDYYDKALSFFKDDFKIIVFSDDIEWCKQNLNNKVDHFIEGEKDYIELYMMSLCKNNIISNSSFSWWGAWLNENENKKIIAPKEWFGPAIQHNTNDIIPDNWIKI